VPSAENVDGKAGVGRGAVHDGFEPAPAAGVTAPSMPSLPPAVAAAKARLLELASANTLNPDVKGVRAQLEPHVKLLSDWFAANRPDNELALTRGTWKSLFYDSPDLDRGPIKLDKTDIYQVVEDGYYWNISESKPKLFGIPLGTVQGFLKGNYVISDAPGPDNRGQPRLNVINLEFAETRVKLGGLPRDVDLRKLADEVNDRRTFTLPSPGPRGVRGQLWNLYVDDQVRVAAGINAGDPNDLQLYVLRRTTTPSN